MATIYTLGNQAKPKKPVYYNGRVLKTVHAQFTKGASDANGTIYVLAQGLPVSARIHRLQLPSGVAATAGLTSVDFGFYKADNATAITANALVSAQTFATALANIDLLSVNGSLDRTKTIGQLLSLTPETEPQGGVTLAATANTSGANAVTIDMDIVIEYAD